MPLIKKKKKNYPILSWSLAKPGRLIVLSFAGLIFIGTVLLTLPISSSGGQWTSVKTALFTATSASCVTGLILEDTATYWSTFGQVIIISLIQLGGLGLATITSFFFSFAGERKSWRTLTLASETTSVDNVVEVMSIVRWIIAITVSIEFLGSVLLIWQLWPYFGLQAIWKGLFQSISSFCNAGFDLNGDTSFGLAGSLAGFNADAGILLTTAGLLIAGGLGFVVWRDLILFPKRKKLNFHSKLVLVGSAILLVGGMVFFLALEWSNRTSDLAMGALPASQRPLAAFFQSATLRTAGFYSIDQASLTTASKELSILLMFIGGGPAGTAGGVKLTSMILTMTLVVTVIKKKGDASLFQYRFKSSSLRNASVVIFLGLTIVLSAVWLLSLFESSGLSSGQIQSIDLVYEVASAFGTVGVTAVGTSNLTGASQVVLIACMFLGRVGPASFLMAMGRDRDREPEIVKADAETLIG